MIKPRVNDVKSFEKNGGDAVLKIRCPAEIEPYLVPQGSITVDGVSLTLVKVKKRNFTVHLIPHTWRETAFETLSPGALVNLETDMIGKYVRAAMGNPGERSAVTWDALRNAGFLA